MSAGGLPLVFDEYGRPFILLRVSLAAGAPPPCTARHRGCWRPGSAAWHWGSQLGSPLGRPPLLPAPPTPPPPTRRSPAACRCFAFFDCPAGAGEEVAGEGNRGGQVQHPGEQRGGPLPAPAAHSVACWPPLPLLLAGWCSSCGCRPCPPADQLPRSRHNAVQAAKAVSRILRTSLGPKGMDKMLQGPDGDIVISAYAGAGGGCCPALGGLGGLRPRRAAGRAAGWPASMHSMHTAGRPAPLQPPRFRRLTDAPLHPPAHATAANDGATILEQMEVENQVGAGGCCAC